MINKKIIIASVLIIVAAVSAGTVLYYSTEPYVYIPSDITNANPDIILYSNATFTIPDDIQHVKEEIVLTVAGTVTDVGGPVTWRVPGAETHASIPVTMSVSEYSKNTENIPLERGDELMFQLSGDYYGDFYLHNFEPQFEIGEEIIIHLGNSEYGINGVGNDNYYPPLGNIAKYKIVNGKAYNKNHVTGISVSDVFDEAL